MANATLEGNVLTITQRGLLSSKTTSVNLDALRLAYVFLPSQFKWQPGEMRTQYQYIDLEGISDQDFANLKNAMQVPGNRPLSSMLKFLLRDYQGQSLGVSNKDLAQGGLDLFAQLEPGRSARRQQRAQWLAGKPAVRMGAATLSAEGVGKGSRSVIPWSAIEKLEFREERYIHFVPYKGSGHKRFFIGVPSKELEACMVEIDFWRSL